jgi:dihydropteroate synthase
VPISIDTSRPAVMRAAVVAGACSINDVRALSLPGAPEAAADLQVPVCLAHNEWRTRNHAALTARRRRCGRGP